MSSRRRSFGRFLLVAILAVLALLLLELGRLLPGSWPGGRGDEGSRSFPVGRAPDPTRLVPSTAPPPNREKPTERGTLHIVVRRADGTPVDGGSVRVAGAGGTSSVDVVEGEALLRVGAALPDDWTISLPDGARVGHGRAPSAGDGRWIVTLPRESPAVAPSATTFGSRAAPAVRVEDAEGHPIPGAMVTATGPRGERQLETGVDGAAAVPDAGGVQRYCVTAKGYGEACAYARLEAGKPWVVRLSPMQHRQTTFVDPATGNPLHARSLTLIDRRGASKRLEREGRSFDQFDVNMPDDIAAETTLEIDVEGRPPTRVPLASMAATTPIPAGVARAVRVQGGAGVPVAGALVTARFAAGPSSENGSAAPIEVTATTDASGQASLSLPIDRDTDLIVESPGFVAEGMRVPANTAPRDAPFDLAASPGIDCVVTVRDEAGAPVAGADVLVLFAAGRMTARRRATTDASGEATVRAVPAGRVEVLVHRAGARWTSQTNTGAADAHRLSFTLHPGHRLTLVVEDASGAPLPHVAVRSVPRATSGSPAPDTGDPDAILPWETNESGVLVVDDLDEREVDLYLSKAGFDEEVVARVRPGPSTWFATLVRAGKVAPK